ncbi:MAG: LCP family protein [Candidatus Moranbacteria bacterium]|nr:LCP family protein [Candidatus Moranbacteria bacterium]
MSQPYPPHFERPSQSPYNQYINQPNNFPPKKRRGRFWIWLAGAAIVLLLAFAASMALAYKFYTTSQKVIDGNQDKSFLETVRGVTKDNHKPLRGEDRGRINILLVGLAGKNYPGTNLTDTIIIASVNPKTWQTALLSIPRDLFVPIPGTKLSTKINALYARSEDTDASGKSGIDNLKETLTDITGQPIDYYIALDFDGFKQIIDELGGVKIQVPEDLHDERYPGPNYSYQIFDLKAGLQDLDGETALKYARTRHDKGGDFGRAYRQQQILEAARSKAYSLGTILNIPKITGLLDTLGDHLRTNIQIEEMGSFLDLVEKIDTHTTINKVLDAGKPDSVMAVSHVFLGGVRAFILIPRVGDYSEIQDISKNIFDLDALARKQKEVEDENASVAIVNESGTNGFDGKVNALFKKMGYDSKVISASHNRTIISQTLLYDLTDGLKPFSLENLSKKLPAKIVSENSMPENCKDFNLCLILGSDLTDRLNYEENSVEDLESGYDQDKIDEKSFIDLLKKGSSVKY